MTQAKSIWERNLFSSPPIPVNNQFWERKIKELKVLRSFTGDFGTFPKFSTRDLHRIIEEKIVSRDLIHSSFKAAPELGETRFNIRKNENPRFLGLEMNFSYQRNGLEFQGETQIQAVYPFLKTLRSWRSRSFYTNSCQAAVSTFLHALQIRGNKPVFSYAEEPYWESLDLIRKLKFPIKKNYPKSFRGGKIYFYDSSTELQEHPFVISGIEKSDLLLIDSTCFPQSSPRFHKVLKAALSREVPVVLIRSHQKLDSLGVEYSRLGSIALLWDEKFSESRKTECLLLWEDVQTALRLCGTSASLRQIYPFAFSAEFNRVNDIRTHEIQRSNAWIFKNLSIKKRKGLLIKRLAHDLFFLLVVPKRISEVELEKLSRALYLLCQIEKIPFMCVASYAWDFVAMTYFFSKCNFYPRVERSSVFRISVPDLDLAQRTRLLYLLDKWIGLIEQDLKLS